MMKLFFKILTCRLCVKYCFTKIHQVKDTCKIINCSSLIVHLMNPVEKGGHGLKLTYLILMRIMLKDKLLQQESLAD